MALQPHLHPAFISCFHNDMSLATEDQQACREQRGPCVGPPRLGGTPGPRRAGTDGATMDPTLASTLRSAGQGQVDSGIFMGCLGACLFTEEPGRGPDVVPPWGALGLDHTAQM